MTTHLPEGPKLAGTAPHTSAGAMGGASYEPPRQAPMHYPSEGESQSREPRHSPMPKYRRRSVNPAPLGLLAFATLWWIWGLINVHTRGISFSNGIVPVALALGLAMILSGIICLSRSPNTWGSTFFVLYGAYWISLALFWIPWFNVITLPGAQFGNSLGVYYSGWLILSVLLTLASLRTSLMIVIMMSFLDLVYLLLMVEAFTTSSSPRLQRSAGAFSLVVAALATYAGLHGLMSRDASPFVLPGFEFGDKDD
ncbi:unnamed protein product [Tilletia controversa]|uniref:Uncharacterized protein n=3 Tax=Tilletia TaxID=13289 RepID=A0A8X7SWK7_9BASI|nr:hypothetical protein CF336_g4678 [Tilletia laevis]KAE8195109.1 hypothetical protein CF328_g4544 [Tilletia controversa]KAE8261083.1 hypothetical protein A4X03_0g3558 [Tilletia caries]KAE8199552.1 hypothetical protein CF335_g4146 [Tilletia laevis]KAE8247123.1 hypothetical protein A4X06_0g4682 [Tilletia controversa]